MFIPPCGTTSRTALTVAGPVVIHIAGLSACLALASVPLMVIPSGGTTLLAKLAVGLPVVLLIPNFAAACAFTAFPLMPSHHAKDIHG